MRGVINQRGNVVPVVDLRLKFALPRTEKTVNTCIITEVEVEGETLVLGAMVDSVQEVLDLEPEQIKASPRIGVNSTQTPFGGWGNATASSLSSWT